MVEDGRARGKRLVRGWLTHVAQPAVAVVQQLLMVPIYLQHWSHETFAAWLTIFAAGSLISIADCGLQVVALNLFQRARLSVDPNGRAGAVFSRLFGAYLFVLCGIVACLAAVILALQSWPVFARSELFKVPDFLPSLVVVILASALQLPSALSSMLYRANDRAAVAPALSSCALIIGMLLQWLILTSGGGLLAIALVHAATLISLSAYLTLVHQRRTFPDVRWSVRARAPALVAKELKGAAQYGVPTSIDLALSYAPILLIGALVNDVAAVAAWGLARTLVGLVRQVGAQITLPLIAEVGREYTSKRWDSVASLLFAGLVTVTILTAIACGGLLALGADFFSIWTRGRMQWDAWLVALLILGAMVAAPAIVGQLFALYSGNGLVLTQSKVAQIAVVAATCVPATSHYGANGLAGALALGELAALVGFIWPRLLARNMNAAGQKALLLLVFGALALLAALMLGHLIDFSIQGTGGIAVTVKATFWCILALGPSVLFLWHFVWRRSRLVV